jgi:hypothetical protein
VCSAVHQPLKHPLHTRMVRVKTIIQKSPTNTSHDTRNTSGLAAAVFYGLVFMLASLSLKRHTPKTVQTRQPFHPLRRKIAKDTTNSTPNTSSIHLTQRSTHKCRVVAAVTRKARYAHVIVDFFCSALARAQLMGVKTLQRYTYALMTQ